MANKTCCEKRRNAYIVPHNAHKREEFLYRKNTRTQTVDMINICVFFILFDTG